MGQYEIYEYLKDRPREWFTAQDLAPVFDANPHNVVRCCTKLASSGIINLRVIPNSKNKYEFSIKRER